MIKCRKSQLYYLICTELFWKKVKEILYHIHFSIFLILNTKDYIENYLTLDSGFINFAETYHKKYDFVLLSNDVSEWSSYITEYYQLNKYFKHKIVSGDVQCRKPDIKIYELTLEKINRSPAECVFIDNSVKNLEAAGGLGMQTILFNRDNEDYSGTIVNSFSELADLIKLSAK